jgi:hypothetical protein
VTATIDPVVSSLQQEIKNLREIIISLQDKVNKKCDPAHQQTQPSVQYVDSLVLFPLRIELPIINVLVL